jgi:hypothetical protein
LTIALAGRRWTVMTTNLAAALLLWAMGLLVLWVGFTGQSAFTPEFATGSYQWLRDLFDAAGARLGGAGPLVVLGLAALVLLLILRMPRRARRESEASS